MKNLLLTFMIITSFGACKSVQNDATQNRDIQLLTDSTVYTNSNIYSDTMATVQTEMVPEKISEPQVLERKRRVTSSQPRVVYVPVYSSNDHDEAAPSVATPPIINTPEKSNTGNSETVGAGDNTDTENTSAIPQPEKKKGWNKATQGAVIGGVAGAVGGAIISKKKGLGAIVGGVVGAAGGYIIGKKMDKKDHQFVIQ